MLDAVFLTPALICAKVEAGPSGLETLRKEMAMNQTIASFKVDRLKVSIFANRGALGEAAGQAVAARMKELLKAKKEIFMVFGAAPSQNEFLDTLSRSPGIDWKRVIAFHLDEYAGLPQTALQSFSFFLRQRLFGKVIPGQVHYLNGMAQDLAAECRRYATLFKDHPFDIACIGIGENGHIAFNDPPVADFDDPEPVKVIALDPASRQQQVHDGSFSDLESVPKTAMTLTIPTLFRAESIFCMVPASTKAEAVKKTLEGQISEACPATILRRHANAVLFLEPDSARLIRSFKR
jgi:glucosamine-6-phosphate deaminase